MYKNRLKPVMLMLGVCSLFCVLALIALLEQMMIPPLTLYERWVVVKRFSLVLAVTFIVMALKLQMVVPWWNAVLGWFFCINTIVLGVVLVVLVDVNFEIIFPTNRLLALP
jgi:hypothetical protein